MNSRLWLFALCCLLSFTARAQDIDAEMEHIVTAYNFDTLDYLKGTSPRDIEGTWKMLDRLQYTKVISTEEKSEEEVNKIKIEGFSLDLELIKLV